MLLRKGTVHSRSGGGRAPRPPPDSREPGASVCHRAAASRPRRRRRVCRGRASASGLKPACPTGTVVLRHQQKCQPRWRAVRRKFCAVRPNLLYLPLTNFRTRAPDPAGLSPIPNSISRRHHDDHSRAPFLARRSGPAPVAHRLGMAAADRRAVRERSSRPGNWADEVLKQESYAQPPKELVDAVLAPRHLNVTLANLSPDKKWFLDEIGDGPVVDEDVLEAVPRARRRVHRLQGEPRARADRFATTSASSSSPPPTARRRSIADSRRRARLERRPGRPTAPASPIFAHTDDATHIWIADVATGKSRQLTKTPLLATLVYERSSSPPTASRSPPCSSPTAAPRCRRRRRRRRPDGEDRRLRQEPPAHVSRA